MKALNEFLNERKDNKEVYTPKVNIEHQAQRRFGQSGTDEIMKKGEEYVITSTESAPDGSTMITVTRKDTTPENMDYSVWRFNQYNFDKLMKKL